ncbi:MAG TPA: hypothetical protein VN634_08630 [Candidatus Limnocylindrales bacterium]|nr:hypothetical protein [Candidatus Limnocylindrales bacterium]
MNKLLVAFSVLAFTTVASGCSCERRTTTTTHESVQSVPAEPVVVEKRTSTHVETHTTE